MFCDQKIQTKFITQAEIKNKTRHQLTHLERQLVLILIGEQPHFCRNIAQVVLDKCNRCVETGTAGFLIAVGLFLRIVTTLTKAHADQTHHTKEIRHTNIVRKPERISVKG